MEGKTWKNQVKYILIPQSKWVTDTDGANYHLQLDLLLYDILSEFFDGRRTNFKNQQWFIHLRQIGALS